LDIGLIQGPPGPSGPSGPMSDQVFIGTDDPVTTVPTAEMWFDTDDTRVLGPADMPPGGTEGQALTKVDGTDGNVEWTGPYSPRAHVHAHHWWSSARTWTVTLAAGTYLSTFQHTAIPTAAGLAYINMLMDGVNLNQSKAYVNEAAQHSMLNMGLVVVTIPADGDHVFTLAVGSNTTIDTNDYGATMLIPCEPGAVS
jgi:hypothetical protein